jgi:sporulation protein YlmC with PRC-barrel domain
MRFSEATGRQVVSTSTAVTVGRVDDFVIDPRSRAVVALTVKKTAGGDTVRWSDLTAFGTDAVTVSGAERITEAGPEIAALSGKDHRVMGKRVLTTAGDDIGKVDDVEFDPESGTITALILASGDVAGVRLVGVGSYATVVHPT